MAETANDGAEPRFTGFIDDFVSGRLHGWAVDRHRPDHHACLTVFAKGRLVGLCRADVARPDLVSLMPGEGRHGFECLLHEEVFEAGGFEVFAISQEVFRSLTDAGWPASDDAGLLTWQPFQDTFQGSYGQISDMNGDSLGLRDLGAGPNRTPAHGDLATSTTILVEIGDLLAFHRAHVRVTGIQRVLCGLIDALSTTDWIDDVEFCLLSQRPGFVDVLDTSLLSDLVSTLLGEGADREDLDDKLKALEVNSRPKESRTADVFFIAGAFWIHDRLDRHLAQMREQGTCLGLLVHDLIPITHPHLVSDTTRRAFVAPATSALPQFDFLVTTSAFVAGQARTVLANEVGRIPAIWTVPLPHRSMAGMPEERPGAEVAQQAPPPCPVDGPFVLCVCTIEVRKNHMLLFRVWAGLVRKYGSEAVPRLVLVGRWGWDAEEFRRALERSDNLDGRIAVLSDVGDGALAELYRRCLFTVFPSFAEGWGLPVGESLAAGKVCIASRATAIPEVGGAFCSYFDPHDVLDAFSAIERPIVDRKWLSDREQEIAAEFCPHNWDEASSDLLCGLRAAQARVQAHGVGGDRARGPVFSIADVIDFTGPSRDDDGAPWRARRAASALAAGWHSPGSSGVRPHAREAAIALETDLEAGTRVTVLLRLGGTGRERPCRLQLKAGRDAATVTIVGRRQRWSEVRAVVRQNGILRLTLLGLSEGLFAPDESEAGFELSGIAMLGDDIPRSQCATYREILGLP